jgi:HSP20 family protein
MPFRDLIPWNRGSNLAGRRGEDVNPFMMLQREMNRMFDDVFRGFDLAPFGGGGGLNTMGWPHIEVSETDKEVRVVAELPGLDEKDVQVELANGALVIKGEKKSEHEDKDLTFSERYYGRFERRIPIDDVDDGKIAASFKTGVLTVTLPKSAKAQEKVKRIAINGK